MQDFIIKTNRLQLREFVDSDSSFLYLLNSNPEVLKYTGDVAFQSIDDATLFIKSYDNYRKDGYGRWAVELNKNVIIGWCGLKKHDNEIVDLGFRFLKKYWGQGYATEAAKGCIEFAFSKLKLKQLVGRTDKRNLASIRVLEKCGFNFDKYEFIEGLGETCIYKLQYQNL